MNKVTTIGLTLFILTYYIDSGDILKACVITAVYAYLSLKL